MMEISGSGGAGNVVLLQQWRERMFARTEKEATDTLATAADSAGVAAVIAVAPANPAEVPAPPEPPQAAAGSLSDQMLGVLFGAQGAGGTETEVAARLAAMLERALKAYQPDQVASRPDSA